LVPRLEGDEEKGVVGGLSLAEEAETEDGGVVLDGRILGEDLFDFLAEGVGAVEGGGFGELDIDEAVALIFFGEEGRGQFAADEHGGDGDAGEEEEADDAAADEKGAPMDVAVGGFAEDAVEPGEEAGEGAMGFFFGSEQQGGQSRAERKGVEGGENNGDGNGESELLIEAAGDAGDENGGHEDGGKNEGDGDDGAGDLLHGFESGIFGGKAFFDVALDGFDDDDGVIDDEADGEDEAEEGEGVDGKTKDGEEGEGADERDGDGEERNERGAPALEENIDDKNDEGESLPEGGEDFLDAAADGKGGVKRNGVIEVGGEAALELGHEVSDAFGGVEGVGAGELVDGEDSGGTPVEAAGEIVD